jgi:molecular chaperone HscB
LNSPIERGLYLLKLNGFIHHESVIHDAHEDEEMKNMLIEILELNEMIDEVSTREHLNELEKRVEKLMKPHEQHLKEAFDSNDLEEAEQIISKMKYYKNIDDRLQELKLKFDLDSSLV